MARAVYLAGYSGHHAADLARLAGALDALVLDIRHRPVSRDPQWSGAALARRLGDRYRHLPALGNASYKSGGPVRLVDVAAGVAAVRAVEWPAILLCVCREARRCHRREVAAALRAAGIESRELDWSAGRPVQLTFEGIDG